MLVRLFPSGGGPVLVYHELHHIALLWIAFLPVGSVDFLELLGYELTHESFAVLSEPGVVLDHYPFYLLPTKHGVLLQQLA